MAALSAGMWAVGAAAQQFTIGVLFLDSQGFSGEIQRGIIEGAVSDDVTLITDNSESDPVKESGFLDTTIGAGVAAVITSPVSVEASVPAVGRVSEAGIPVVCYNNCLSAEDTKRLAGGLVTTDQAELGRGSEQLPQLNCQIPDNPQESVCYTATATKPANIERRDSSPPWTPPVRNMKCRWPRGLHCRRGHPSRNRDAH